MNSSQKGPENLETWPSVDLDEKENEASSDEISNRYRQLKVSEIYDFI